MDEQSDLLRAMLAQAETSINDLGKRAATFETSQDLVSLEGAVLETAVHLGAVWLGLLLTMWANRLAVQAGTRRPCRCGQVARWVERRAKTVLTLVGRVTYQRVYYHCRSCGQGDALGDQAWGLAHTRTSPNVRHLVGYVSARIVGFTAAAQIISRALHWPTSWLSGKQVQRLAEPLGATLGAVEEVRIARWWAQVSAGRSAPLVAAGQPSSAGETGPGPGAAVRRLYIQMDGTMARLRGMLGKGSDLWREVKVGAVFWAAPGRHASHLLETLASSGAGERAAPPIWVDAPVGPITYVAGLWSAAHLGVRLYAESVARGLEQAREVVILGDGALWIWNLAAEHFPGATQILDVWHASEWVWKVAKAVWGEGSSAAHAWAEEQIRERLLAGDVRGLVAAIAAVPKRTPPPGQSKSIAEQAQEYFRHNAERMDYPAYRARGLEIGSGTIESAGKRVVHQRCKGPGMRWSEPGLAAILQLRTDVLNQRYDAALARLKEVA